MPPPAHRAVPGVEVRCSERESRQKLSTVIVTLVDHILAHTVFECTRAGLIGECCLVKASCRREQRLTVGRGDLNVIDLFDLVVFVETPLSQLCRLRFCPGGEIFGNVVDRSVSSSPRNGEIVELDPVDHQSE